MVFRTEVGNNLCIHGGYFRVVGAGRKQYMIHRKYVKKGVHNKVVYMAIFGVEKMMFPGKEIWLYGGYAGSIEDGY